MSAAVMVPVTNWEWAGNITREGSSAGVWVEAPLAHDTVSFYISALCQDMGRKGLQCYSCGFDEPCVERIVTCKEGERCGIIKGHLGWFCSLHTDIFAGVIHPIGPLGA